MSDWSRRHQVTEGGVAVEEGSEGASLFRVVSGRVAVRKADEERSITLATLGPGEFFGEMSLFGQEVRSASVVALSDVELEELPAARFHELLEQDPVQALALVRPLIEVLSSRLRRTSAALLALFRLGEACAGATTWDAMAEAVVGALRIAVPAADRAVLLRYNPFAEEDEELAVAGALAAGQAPGSVLDEGAGDDVRLVLQAAQPDAFTPDDGLFLATVGGLVFGAARRLTEAEEAADLARLRARRV